MPSNEISPVLKRILRIPGLLYRAHLGWVLGHRFLALSHRGRRTGRPYLTVLEVVRWDAGRTEAIVLSGLGRHAQWYKNVLAGEAELVRVGRSRFAPVARVLTPAEAGAVVEAYERRNRLLAPVVRRVLGRLAGFTYDGSPAARDRLVATLPLIAFAPRHDAVE